MAAFITLAVDFLGAHGAVMIAVAALPGTVSISQ